SPSATGSPSSILVFAARVPSRDGSAARGHDRVVAQLKTAPRSVRESSGERSRAPKEQASPPISQVRVPPASGHSEKRSPAEPGSADGESPLVATRGETLRPMTEGEFSDTVHRVWRPSDHTGELHDRPPLHPAPRPT